MNLWTKDETCREFAFSKRLARVAAELMGVKGVRIYHDQALYKEAGSGFTPWHADQYYWPLSNENTCTVWIPFQNTPLEMGPLSFAAGSHLFEHGRDLEISDESEAKLQEALDRQNFPYIEEPCGRWARLAITMVGRFNAGRAQIHRANARCNDHHLHGGRHQTDQTAQQTPSAGLGLRGCPAARSVRSPIRNSIRLFGAHNIPWRSAPDQLSGKTRPPEATWIRLYGPTSPCEITDRR